MNSTIPKRHAETLRNWNIPFQSKNRNDDRNSIDNLGSYNFWCSSHRPWLRKSSLVATDFFQLSCLTLRLLIIYFYIVFSVG